MLKLQNISNLKYTKDKGEVNLYIDAESSLQDIKDALGQFLAHVINFEAMQEQAKVQQEASKKPIEVEAPVADVISEVA